MLVRANISIMVGVKMIVYRKIKYEEMKLLYQYEEF